MSSQTGGFDIVIFCHYHWEDIVRRAALVDDELPDGRCVV